MCKIKYMLPIAGASPDHAVEAARDRTMAAIIYDEKSSNVVVGVKHNTSAAAAADQEESNKFVIKFCEASTCGTGDNKYPCFCCLSHVPPGRSKCSATREECQFVCPACDPKCPPAEPATT